MVGGPSAGEVAQQLLRSAVNFGVVSVARVFGAPAADVLALRCECGGASCSESVRISLREYEDARLEGRLLVVRGHAHGGRVFGGNDEWSVVARDATSTIGSRAVWPGRD